jgi:tRNA-Thr(GGU) m(6)t(6)A37 methyltransferase TsaA
MTSPAPPLPVIGVLRSCFREKFGTPRQPGLTPSATATLTIAREFLPAQSLEGLSGFSHVWLISYLHLTKHKKFLSKVHPPRLRGGTIGLFASRAPHRPSPLGLSRVRLERVAGATLYLSGVDLIDGTPILDLKPYIPDWDSVPDASAGWTTEADFPALQIAFSPRAKLDIAAAEKRLATGGIARLLSDALSQDPRNHRDRSQMRDNREMGLLLHDFEAFFVVRGRRATVTRLETGSGIRRAPGARQPPAK